MASGQAYIASLLTKLFIRRRLARVRDPREIRRIAGKTRRLIPPGAVFEAAEFGSTDGEWISAVTLTTKPITLFYIHGGGFVACSAKTHRPLTAALAKRGFRVYAPNYRLAPEHPFPAAIDDVLAAWRALRREIEGPIVVAGDSAGGTLALLLMIALRDAHDELPAAAALFSPATDLTAASASYETNLGRDAMFGRDILEQFRRAYLQEANPRDVRISPLFADLAGLPPILIHVGEAELLRDDAVRFAAAAVKAGVRCELKIWPVVPHVWQLAEPFIPEARRSLDLAAAFLRENTQRTTAAETNPIVSRANGGFVRSGTEHCHPSMKNIEDRTCA